MNELAPGETVTFGDWSFNPRIGSLFHRGSGGEWAPVAIGSRAAALLGVLLLEPGALVTKDALMDAVWPEVLVEANNLTVQIATLRRILDGGRAGESCIQTVPGRGYRFVGTVTPTPIRSGTIEPPAAKTLSAQTAPFPPVKDWRRQHGQLAFGLLLVGLLLSLGIWGGARPRVAAAPAAPPPRMSIAIAPFENLDGDPETKRFARAIADDVTTELFMRTSANVVPATGSADQRNARYLLTGSVRRLNGTFHLSIQLAATESGTLLWTDRIDLPAANIADAEEHAVKRIGNALRVNLFAVEAERSRTDHPDNPDALDLYLRGQSLHQQLPGPTRDAEELVLYERALQRDPSSDLIKMWLIPALLDTADDAPRGTKAVLERTGKLLASIRPDHRMTWNGMLTQLFWLYAQRERCAETSDMARRIIAAYPGTGAPYRLLGHCEIRAGRAEAAIKDLETEIRLEPNSPYIASSYRDMMVALLVLGRYEESIAWGERALKANPDAAALAHAGVKGRLAAAYALAGHLDAAHRTMDEARRINPWFTARSAADVASSPVYAAQLERVREGMRLAGLRDHADETADFGTPSDDRIRQTVWGPTPLTVPGAATIRTEDLARLQAERHPLVIDTLWNFAGHSLPGALGLRHVGEGGDLSDVAQDLLRTKMHDLTNGDFGKPIVAVGWNAQTFDGRNLALRLGALGYTQVYWYRGGREAWEFQGLPETELAAADW